MHFGIQRHGSHVIHKCDQEVCSLPNKEAFSYSLSFNFRNLQSYCCGPYANSPEIKSRIFFSVLLLTTESLFLRWCSCLKKQIIEMAGETDFQSVLGTFWGMIGQNPKVERDIRENLWNKLSWLEIVAWNLCNILQRWSRGNDEECYLFFCFFFMKIVSYNFPRWQISQSLSLV